MTHKQDSERGFTVLEALVAFAILTAVMTAALRLSAQGLPRLSASNERREAVEGALSLVAEVRVAEQFSAGSFVRGNYRVALIELRPRAESGARVFKVEVWWLPRANAKPLLETVVVGMGRRR